MFWRTTTSRLSNPAWLGTRLWREVWSGCLLWFVWEQHLGIIPDNLCFTSHVDELRNFNEPVCRAFCLCMNVQLTCISNAVSLRRTGVMPSAPWSVPLKHNLSRAEVKLVCRSQEKKAWFIRIKLRLAVPILPYRSWPFLYTAVTQFGPLSFWSCDVTDVGLKGQCW